MKSLTRKELFDLVWEKPMTKVAADFAISDVGLKKICTKHRMIMSFDFHYLPADGEFDEWPDQARPM